MMGVCSLELRGISYFFILFLVFVVSLGEGQNGCHELIRCGGRGQNYTIRFPFRLDTQPDLCGYPIPGFTLSSTHTNDTVLQLPNFVKLFVENIDYKSQVIEVYDPVHCFPRQLRDLNLSSSPFLFKHQPYQYDYAFFNCSSNETHYYHAISCLSGPSHEVRAFSSVSNINNLPIASCKKMYTLPSISYYQLFDYDNILRLKWDSPKCGHCERKGKDVDEE
ncbi:putative RING-H2 finger protein ATL21A [Corylus avellana]|uniref:putative RING-H2 finger protein ATL21A n=1 Tax=Corylus avellana TaxID=13451 RepID=UPI00286C389E|nr:putative RING-H2 finger protein ATL21A [Corylus avellana]